MKKRLLTLSVIIFCFGFFYRSALAEGITLGCPSCGSSNVTADGKVNVVNGFNHGNDSLGGSSAQTGYGEIQAAAPKVTAVDLNANATDVGKSTPLPNGFIGYNKEKLTFNFSAFHPDGDASGKMNSVQQQNLWGNYESPTGWGYGYNTSTLEASDQFASKAETDKTTYNATLENRGNISVIEKVEPDKASINAFSGTNGKVAGLSEQGQTNLSTEGGAGAGTSLGASWGNGNGTFGAQNCSPGSSFTTVNAVITSKPITDGQAGNAHVNTTSVANIPNPPAQPNN